MNGGVNKKSGGKEEEQDGLSVHSPCKAPNSSASSLRKEQSQVDLELKLLEALEIYPPFSASDVLQMLDRFYNLEMLKPDDEESGILNQVEEFSLPPSYFSKEES
ncbi:Chromatin modification-related protein EAF7 [Cynara cardunculus var. scolymus]|uniref:Chromatin modification-related protein EAF7 n=1 Tax=Cynara cardunculus var. scolymus TaxID=59895 RepID=A0A118JXE1_CYNCS|nr:Chromatin modification-related protein EAF7 [Cynara cardunculus var. scolymus]